MATLPETSAVTAMACVQETDAEDAPEERWARRMVMNGRQREHATGRGRGA